MSSLTILTDVILTQNVISAAINGRTTRSNTRNVDGGGFPKINANWSRSIRYYDLAVIPLPVNEFQLIETIFEVTDAGAMGFLIRDPKDWTVRTGEGFLSPWDPVNEVDVGTVGQGYGVPVYRLKKRYARASRTHDRLITRPYATPALKRNGVALVAGSGAGEVAIDLNTGTVTFVPDATQSVLSITAGADTVLTFSSGSGVVASAVVGEYLYLTGVTGTAATTLNATRHLIKAVDPVLFTVTLETSTVGLTGAAGTAAIYPQADDALTWTGDFYVPVHFMNDELNWDIVRSGPEETRYVSGNAVMLQEVPEK